MKKLPILLLSLATLLALFSPASPGVSQHSRPDETQIRDYLVTHPLITGPGAEVLDVLVQRGALVIDLDAAVLPNGVYEEALFTQLQADLDQAFNINLFYMTTFKVEGELLEYWGRPMPDFTHQVEPPSTRELPGAGPLAGVRIALSPGHGRYWNETYSAWFWQRSDDHPHGIREDTLNAEIMRYVQAALINQGATVIQLRELDFNARIGISGYPAWHEAARQYAIAQGLPDWVYNGGSTNYNSDIRARPYMANYYGADILISLHNNGWNGTLSGTETYWDLHNHPGSYALARAVHDSIINTIRTEKDPAWVDRGVKASNRNYGEISYAQMPAILLELAFMDKEYPDNAYLQTESFKLLAANAITRGVCDFWGVTCESVSITLPQTLETPTLTPEYGDGMCDSGWHRFPNQRGQYAYLALNAAGEDHSTHQAAWQPVLPVRGEYRLEVFIPAHGTVDWQCPGITLNGNTSQAVYQIVHANGITTNSVNQGAVKNDWVDLGIFHFDNVSQAMVTLTNLTQETQHTTTVSASAMRFTLVGNAGTPFYNTAWVNGSWLRDGVNAPLDHIRHFMAYHGTCLDTPIIDSDGQAVDIPSLIHQAAIDNQINPKFLLAIMEAKQGALSHCPDPTALENLMGLDPPTTARDQIATAASQVGHALHVLETTQKTPHGWVPGMPKLTHDGVSVTPANDTIAILFDYSQNAGTLWGGTAADNNGVQGIYAAWRDYRLNSPLFWGMNPVYLPLLQR